MIVLGVTLAQATPDEVQVMNATAHTASIDGVKFAWSPNHGGSLLATCCVKAKWNWLSSTELTSDNNNPDNDRPLGAWKWPESGCRTLYATVNSGKWFNVEIGFGASDSEPRGNLYQLPGTKVYSVYVVGGKVTSVRLLRTITPENAWCTRGNCTFRNPAGTPCEQDAQRLGPVPMHSGNVYFADVFIVWSPACQAVWGKAESRWEFTRYFIRLNFLNDRRGGWGLSSNNPTEAGYARWTDMASQNEPTASVCAMLTVNNTDLEGEACTSVK